MECVYKKTGILFKLFPILLLVVYIVMCLIGTNVYASDIVDYEIRNFDDNDLFFPVSGKEFKDYIILNATSDNFSSSYDRICLFLLYVDKNYINNSIYIDRDSFCVKSLDTNDSYSAVFQFLFFNLEKNVWEKGGNISFGVNTKNGNLLSYKDRYDFLYSPGLDIESLRPAYSYSIKKINGEIIYNTFKKPHFVNKADELATGNFDILQIDPGDFSPFEDKFYFRMFEKYIISDDVYNYYGTGNLFRLTSKSNYFHSDGLDVNFKSYYYIPRNKLGLEWKPGTQYLFELCSTANTSTGLDEVYDSIEFTVGDRTQEQIYDDRQDVTDSKIDDQTDAIKENTETNKGIWNTIKDIVSYINPLSENFFVYKLIELLVNAIKSLFIPSDDFFSTFFTTLKDWFSDRLGFLFYPFELIIDVLNKMLNINFSDPIFDIPDFIEPTTGVVFIHSTTFNLNDMLNNSVFKTIHNIYLILVDAVIIFGLVNLAKRKWEEVSSK